MKPGHSNTVLSSVSKKAGYNGMIQSGDLTEKSLDGFIEELTLNIPEISPEEFLLTISPNPFKNHLMIESPVNDKITLQDPSGRIILQQSVSKGRSRVQTERLTSGMYFVHFEKQCQTFKIVKR